MYKAIKEAARMKRGSNNTFIIVRAVVKFLIIISVLIFDVCIIWPTKGEEAYGIHQHIAQSIHIYVCAPSPSTEWMRSAGLDARGCSRCVCVVLLLFSTNETEFIVLKEQAHLTSMGVFKCVCWRMLPRRKDEESICKFTTLPVILEISTNFCVAWVLSFWRTQINLMVQNRTELSALNIYKIDPARARKQLRCKFHSGGNLAQDPEPFQFACFLHIIAPSSWTHVAMLFCWLPANLHSLANAPLCTYSMSKIRSTKLFLQEVGGEATYYLYILILSLLHFSCAWKDKQSIKSRGGRETAASAKAPQRRAQEEWVSRLFNIIAHTHSLTHSLGKARSSAQEREDSN